MIEKFADFFLLVIRKPRRVLSQMLVVLSWLMRLYQLFEISGMCFVDECDGLI